MAKCTISGVALTPNPVNVNGALKISVQITEIDTTWNYLKENYTWDSLKTSGETWNTLKE